jgi:hypothetical protein
MNNPDEFEVILKKINGRIVATVPQLGLMAGGKDFASALSSLEESKEKLMTELEVADLRGLVSASVTESRSKLFPQLGLFALKSAVLAAIIVVTIGASASLVLGGLYEKFSGPQFWSSLERKLADKASSPGIPDAQRQKILADVRLVVNRWQPFVFEVSRLWSSPGVPNGIDNR